MTEGITQGRLGHPLIDLRIIGGGDRQVGPLQVGIGEVARPMLQFPCRPLALQGGRQCGRHQPHPGTGAQQIARLAGSHLTAAHHQAVLAFDIEKDRQVLHRVVRLIVWVM
jgi:hypothetical protein